MTRRRFSEVALWVGAVVMVVGTFAPWLRSGQVTRNSYRAAGLFERVLGIDGAAGQALDAMPLLALVCAAAIALFVFGFARVVAVVLGLLGLALGALALALLVAPGNREVSVVEWGPAITLAGGVLTVAAAIALVFVHRVDRTYRQVST